MYARSFNNTSARANKTGVEPVDPGEVLSGVRSLSVSTWEFTDTDDGWHMGPMAGEFYERFGLGDDDKTIASVDADGVALAAIQGLSQQLDDAREELAAKDERIDALEDRLSRIETELDVEKAPADD